MYSLYLKLVDMKQGIHMIFEIWNLEHVWLFLIGWYKFTWPSFFFLIKTKIVQPGLILKPGILSLPPPSWWSEKWYTVQRELNFRGFHVRTVPSLCVSIAEVNRIYQLLSATIQLTLCEQCAVWIPNICSPMQCQCMVASICALHAV